jgi:hypothetical protein
MPQPMAVPLWPEHSQQAEKKGLLERCCDT